MAKKIRCARMLGNQRGQTTIFMALFISTMVMLLAFTTNLGMFVHAKINLQNAADAAAYSGAAVQARLLTNAAYLNFEMRRAMKEFLFRYMVRGNSSQTCFPSLYDGGTTEACPGRPSTERYTFNLYDPREGIKEDFNPFIPSVCITFSTDNNYCQKAAVAGLAQVQAGGYGVADPLIASIQANTQRLIREKIIDCEKRTEGNVVFLTAWLFSIDPSAPIEIVNQGDQDYPSEYQGFPGIGALPKAAIIRARIVNIEDTLNLNLVNEGFNGEVNDSTLASLTSQSPIRREYFERPILAYLSARNNLVTENNNGIFSEVKMTELLPASGESPSTFAKNPAILARFNDINGPFTISYSSFVSGIVGGDEGGCTQVRRAEEIPSFPYGVYKDPSIVTYYAVKLSAKAKLLFNPFGKGAPVTLTAYSAAKPFGSRIGKNIGARPEEMMYATGVARPEDMGIATAMRFANLLVGKDHISSLSDGFAQRQHLGYLRYIELSAAGRRNGAFRVAGAYAPWELGYYTPAANFSKPVEMGIFDENPNFNGEGGYMLRAPLPSPVAGEDMAINIRNIVDSYLSSINTVSTGTGSSSSLGQVMRQKYLTDDNFANLFAFMQSNGQDMAHPILDPFLQDMPDLLALIRGIGGERFTVAASQDQPELFQLTSWNNQKTTQEVRPESELGLGVGRSGYSVRFVSFQQLSEGGQGSTDPDGSGSFTNPFTRLGGSAAALLNDISKIRH